MEGEIKKFIKVWVQVFVATCYCYLVAKIVHKGTTRLITFLPVVCLFLALPLDLSSIHFGIITGFFITWLANFKLVLFAFGEGPLSNPSLSLGHFLILTCFPVKIQQSPPPKPPPILVKPPKNKHTNQSLKKPINDLSNGNTCPKTSTSGLKSPLNYATKASLSAIILFLNEYYKDYLHPKVFQFLMCLYIYMALEILLAMLAIVARVLLKSELEPQFNEPYLSTSLKDFWGRRWNLMASDTLRLTVFKPFLHLALPVLGHKWSYILAVLGTFLVSAFIHELMIYYVGRQRPTWGITWFFLLHGLCLIVEANLKNFTDKWWLHGLITRPLIFGFVITTFIWLVSPYLLWLNVDVRATKEYEVVGAFVKDFGIYLKLIPSNASNILV